ncbi:MAG: PEP-CTERM sorting domain-containing protein [Leptolyngbya sp. SIO1D8]|nr:PEP-CTERM sorting domain-containing protein [Leptolyngbya sp. SIO1D8]
MILRSAQLIVILFMLKYTLIVPAALLWAALVPASLQAANIYYTTDSFSDGVTGNIVGGTNSTFELYGIGYAQTETTLYIGLNTNLPIGGAINPQAIGGSVAWGDLFLNFSSQPFSEAVADGQVYGIRFDAANDSPMSQLGLYQVQQTSSVAPFNTGFASLAEYQSVVTQAGGTASLGDIPLDGSYLSNTNSPQNVISQGTLLSNQVSFIEDFSTVGFNSDFGFSPALSETGSYTYGFSVNKAKLPLGEFIAHVLAECANDGIAFVGTLLGQDNRPKTESVPEPTTGLALLGLGTVYGVTQLKRRR